MSSFNDQEIVALIGAHAVGRCHTDRSGFEGPWTFSPITFTNDFYKLLFDEKWGMIVFYSVYIVLTAVLDGCGKIGTGPNNWKTRKLEHS